jgi:hypothetical protein
VFHLERKKKSDCSWRKNTRRKINCVDKKEEEFLETKMNRFCFWNIKIYVRRSNNDRSVT